MESIDDQLAIKHPAWKHALEQIRESGVSYGYTVTTEQLCIWLRCERESNQFVWNMISLRQRLERDDGYYLASVENGKAWKVVEAPAHEDVSKRFDAKVRSYALRSVHLRSATLVNPAANLADSKRSEIERNLAHASTRLALISRRLPPMKTIQ